MDKQWENEMSAITNSTDSTPASEVQRLRDEMEELRWDVAEFFLHLGIGDREDPTKSVHDLLQEALDVLRERLPGRDTIWPAGSIVAPIAGNA